MRALVVTNLDRADIEQIVDHASRRENWYDARDKSPGWLDKLPGDNPQLCYKIFDGYRCVFSYTLDTELRKVYRHLSISVDGKDYPSPEAIQLLAPLFGFTGELTPAPRYFPEGWHIQVKQGDQLDDHCIVVAQEVDIVIES